MIQGWESPLERGLADLRELRSLLRCLKAGITIVIPFQGKILEVFLICSPQAQGSGQWDLFVGGEQRATILTFSHLML